MEIDHGSFCREVELPPDVDARKNRRQLPQRNAVDRDAQEGEELPSCQLPVARRMRRPLAFLFTGI